MPEPIQYGIVDPHICALALIRAEDFDTAKRAAGLHPLQVDHGPVTRNVAICVAEDGLLEAKPGAAYFALARQLYAGSAVLYGFNERGETVDFVPDTRLMDSLRFYRTAAEADAAIRRGEIARPRQTVNGMVLWEWTP